ncbi:FtsK/SpoIIIE domain-containing protein [Solwaraspora sp. WMMD406]|uniref:FtsK/SpoIIIE domain-containing protein n=1 Tax=Solwaraspora sp. WMMD406 TaxID=3016095 RepID=UPI002417783A|nr:FtsK/SpoIIIE domain-containing protein [Solwaraspora sp. WMMD406]MDG4765402.1 FtsK/SpoIIIE domain-containing protein [Solwaraspora sp. WMMD406]
MSFGTALRRAITAHRQAITHLGAARRAIADAAPPPPPDLTDVTSRLRRVGEALTTGATGSVQDPAAGPAPVRLGMARPAALTAAAAPTAPATPTAPAVDFPALVPLGAGAHLAIDADARQPRVAALLRSLVVRLLAAAPPGTVRVIALDTSSMGATFLPLRPLVEAAALGAPASTDAETKTLLDDADQHVRTAQGRTGGDHSGGVGGGAAGTELLVVVAGALPDNRADLMRLAALTHAGAAARVCVIVAGYPPAGTGVQPPALGATTQVTVDGNRGWIGDPPGQPFSSDGTGLAVPVALDGDPPARVVEALAERLGDLHRRGSALDFADLLPPRIWTETSVDGLHTVVGRAGREPAILAFDDVTPHWLVGGRTGSGKTVFLLDLLYGLAARYSPDELALYLLDFKEGVSFTEFVPTGRDPSWIPHARAVGIESDREYGVAVLRELRRELNRRAAAMKRHGVTKLADLPRDGTPTPRTVAVIDEFHVLFEGNDSVAREAAALLEELARKGRSYGVHLVLASQSMSGIEALYGKTDSIFGQFPLRVALPGGNGVLDPLNHTAGGLPIGQAIVNPSAGIAGANTIIRFPDAHGGARRIGALRHELWQSRAAGSRPPAIFKGYEAAHLRDDPTFRSLAPGGRRPLALVGRQVDVDLSSAVFALDATPGRHLAVVGTTGHAADVLHAATVSLAKQEVPGQARFLFAPLVASADEVAEEAADELHALGHAITRLTAVELREELRRLAKPDTAAPEPAGSAGQVPPAAGSISQVPPAAGRTYLVVFGMDAAAGVLGAKDEMYKSGLDDLQVVLRQGPGHGVHLLGWWRGLRRLADDLGGSHNRDDLACLVAMNVPGGELGSYLGTHELAYRPRPNRALLIDRHDQRTRLIVPFALPGRELDEEG